MKGKRKTLLRKQQKTGARLAHQIGHMLGGQEEGEKQVAPPTEE
jgi:hypothetical protein